jgi:hypothetical protein
MLNLEAETVNALGRTWRGLGDAARALATAEEAIEVAQRRGARHHEADSWIVVAENLLAASGANERARIEQALHRAETLIRETGARLPEPELHLARASLAAALGDTRGRDAALQRARQVLIEMGAPERAERVEDEPSGSGKGPEYLMP